jgi:catechol 2,3-dioxygenase-like lactoylglutathione lyase family enzyme
MRVGQLDHLTVTSRDPEQSIRFYTEVLGMERSYEWAGEITMLKAGGTFLAIAYWAKGSDASRQPAITVDHFAFRVDRATYEGARAELDAQGVVIDHESDHGICRSLYFRDPDGHLVELVCYELTGAEAKKPTGGPQHSGSAPVTS